MSKSKHATGVDFSSISDLDFEYLCEALLRKKGFPSILRPGAGPDAGVDLLATRLVTDGMGITEHEIYLVECKRWTKRISSKDLGDIRSKMQQHGANRYLLATSSGANVTVRDLMRNITEDATPLKATYWAKPDLMTLLDEFPDVKLHFFPAASQLDLGAFIRDIRAWSPPEPATKESALDRAEEHINSGEAESALEKLEGLNRNGLTAVEQERAVMLRAMALYETRRWSELEAFRKSLEDRPTDTSPPTLCRVQLLSAWRLLSEEGDTHDDAAVLAAGTWAQSALRLVSDLAHYHSYRTYRAGDLGRARNAIELSAAVRRTLGLDADFVKTLVLQSILLKSSGDLRGAQRVAAQAVDEARASGNAEQCQHALLQLSISHYRQGSYDRALQAIDEGLSLSPRAEIKRHVAALWLAKARVHTFRSEAHEAESCLGEARNALQEAHHPRLEALYHEFRGLVQLEKAEGTGALAEMTRSRELLEQCKVQSYELAEIYLRIAQAHLCLCATIESDRKRGEIAEAAHQEVKKGLKCISTRGTYDAGGLARGHLFRAQALAANHLGRPRRSVSKLLEKAEVELRRTGDLHELALLLMDRAELFQDDERASKWAEEAKMTFTMIGLEKLHARAEAIQARL